MSILSSVRLSAGPNFWAEAENAERRGQWGGCFGRCCTGPQWSARVPGAAHLPLQNYLRVAWSSGAATPKRPSVAEIPGGPGISVHRPRRTSLIGPGPIFTLADNGLQVLA